MGSRTESSSNRKEAWKSCHLVRSPAPSKCLVLGGTCYLHAHIYTRIAAYVCSTSACMPVCTSACIFTSVSTSPCTPTSVPTCAPTPTPTPTPVSMRTSTSTCLHSHSPVRWALLPLPTRRSRGNRAFLARKSHFDSGSTPKVTGVSQSAGPVQVCLPVPPYHLGDH